MPDVAQGWIYGFGYLKEIKIWRSLSVTANLGYDNSLFLKSYYFL
jgi:hypothetical protein